MCIIPKFSAFLNILTACVFLSFSNWFEDTSLSGLFPEEQKKYNITKDVIRSSVVSNVSKARDYLCKVNPAVLEDKLDVKFSVIIEKPTEEDHLPMSILISPMSR